MVEKVKETLEDRLLRELENNEIFVDWYGSDFDKIVSSNYEMKFIRVSNGMVVTKEIVRWRDSKEYLLSLKRILDFCLDEKRTSKFNRPNIILNLPIKLRKMYEVGYE